LVAQPQYGLVIVVAFVQTNIIPSRRHIISETCLNKERYVENAAWAISTRRSFFWPVFFRILLANNAPMHLGKTVFTQVMEWVHPEQFRRCVTRYHGSYKVTGFPCWEQFLAMSFAQMTFRESLADIEICLRSLGRQFYHLGSVSR
jgi:hypothetical protein